jgi:hypothetical protein
VLWYKADGADGIDCGIRRFREFRRRGRAEATGRLTGVWMRHRRQVTDGLISSSRHCKLDGLGALGMSFPQPVGKTAKRAAGEAIERRERPWHLAKRGLALQGAMAI